MLASRAGISPVMVGRAAELTTLERLLDASAGPQVALITGEAGVGKSRLVREFLARSSAVVLAGQATEGDLGHPFEAFRDALEQTVVGWSDLPLEPLRGAIRSATSSAPSCRPSHTPTTTSTPSTSCCAPRSSSSGSSPGGNG